MPKRSSKGWIGLDLGHRNITVAQIERVAGDVRIVAAEVPRTQARSGADSRTPDYRDVSRHEILTARTVAEGLTGSSAACVLPMSVTDLTHQNLPPAEPREQYAMIASELGSGERLQFDFWPTNLANGGAASTLMDVNVISLPQTRANMVAEQVTAARMNCRVLDGLPQAIARAVAMAVPEAFGSCLGGLHLAYDNALFVLSRDGCPVFARLLRGGGMHQIFTQVSESLGLLEEEAVHVLRECGLPPLAPSTECDQIQDVLGEIVAGTLDAVADELKRTLSYLASLGPGNVPDSICLLGEGAAIPNLSQHLSATTDSSIWDWDLPGATLHRPTTPPVALLAIASALSSLAWES